MNLIHPEQPTDVPEDAQFYGPEDDDFFPCWYKFNEGKWWALRIDRPEKGWFVVDMAISSRHTLGTTIFMLKDYVPTAGLRKDTERLRESGTGQLRWANNRVEYFSHTENNWRKSGISKEAFENRCPPLTDLNWPPKTQEGNDVDSW